MIIVNKMQEKVNRKIVNMQHYQAVVRVVMVVVVFVMVMMVI